MRILITGANGNVGSEIITNLNQMKNANIEVFAAVRNPEKTTFAGNVKSVKFDFEDPSTFSILTGFDSLFLMRPPHISNVPKYIKPVIDAAEKAGVKHIVFLSLLGVEHNKITPHYKIEQLIMKSTMRYTFLRAGFFMQNLSTTHLRDIVEDDRIYLPAGNGKTSFTDIRDIAAVGAKALAETNSKNIGYDITGSEAITYYEVADILTNALGRKITYQPASIIGFYRHMRKQGGKPAYIVVVTILYLVTKFGKAANIACDFEKVMARKPITFRQFAFDTKEIFSNARSIAST